MLYALKYWYFKFEMSQEMVKMHVILVEINVCLPLPVC